jgi:hypothetical protein
MRLTLWNTLAIAFVYSLLLIAFDEWVARPWRRRRWERKAQAGDRDAQELLRIAREVHISE